MGGGREEWNGAQRWWMSAALYSAQSARHGRRGTHLWRVKGEQPQKPKRTLAPFRSGTCHWRRCSPHRSSALHRRSHPPRYTPPPRTRQHAQTALCKCFPSVTVSLLSLNKCQHGDKCCHGRGRAADRFILQMPWSRGPGMLTSKSRRISHLFPSPLKARAAVVRGGRAVARGGARGRGSSKRALLVECEQHAFVWNDINNNKKVTSIHTLMMSTLLTSTAATLAKSLGTRAYGNELCPSGPGGTILFYEADTDRVD